MTVFWGFNVCDGCKQADYVADLRLSDEPRNLCRECNIAALRELRPSQQVAIEPEAVI